MKINRIVMSLVAVFCLCVSFNAFAGADLSSLKASKQSANASKKTLGAASYYKTDVHVFNNSSQVIRVKVPGTSINDTLFPGEIEDLYSEAYLDSIMVILYDDYGYEFFHDYVPNHATLQIRDLSMAKSVQGGKQDTKLQAVIKN